MRTFQQRLHQAQRGGNLTVADLSRWFGRPHPTVRQWVRKGINPGGGPLDIEEVWDMLKLLEKLIRAGKGFPLVQMSPSERIVKLLQVRQREVR